ncbi:MAG: hypothetical protein WBB69_15645 [Anaerolineales bacterium]
MKSTAFCITGWHYPLDFYQAFAGISDVDIYIVSHQKRLDIPDFLIALFSEEQILFRSNIGYDWGCYQQFINSGLWQQYQTLFFLHDDIKIHDFGFVEEAKEMLKTHAVIGNGQGKGGVSFTGVRSHPYAYVHSSYKPGSFEFQHHTVRGSFFATTSAFIKQLKTFEVYWDPLKIFIGFGNWSTKATCGKMEETFGPNCFGYLSDTFGQSKYITEFVRGEDGGDLSQPEGIRLKIYRLIKRISSVYLEIYYRERASRVRSAWLMLLRPFLSFFSGKLY